jgi:holin-like protein
VLLACLILIGFQLLGEMVHQYFKLPLPGPVVGMFLLAAVLVYRQRAAGRAGEPAPPALMRTANALIGNMGLLFVPAGAGIMTQSVLLHHSWVPIAAGVVGSTLLSLTTTGLSLHHASSDGS